LLTNAKGRIRVDFAAVLTLAAAALAWPASALAQCPLCRSALQHAGDQTAHTMNLAIVVLLIPPVSIFCTIFAVAYRKSKEGDEEDGESQVGS
jgi:heme/copper-type cytochrome/quinol oxidase subunit 2